jgi:hypothetical protein
MLGVTKSSYWKNVNPTGAISDFRTVFRDAGRNRWKIALGAALTTASLFWLLTHETWRAPPPRPKILYINSWPKSRTAAETKAFITKNQKWKDDRAAEQAQSDEEVRKMYKALGRVSGMDVDKIEKDAQAEASASAAAEDAKIGRTPPVDQN